MLVAQSKSPEQDSLESSKPLSKEMTRVIEIFNRDYVRPRDCDEATSVLSRMANSPHPNQISINLQLALRSKMVRLINQITEFRKICQNETHSVDEERKRILKIARRLQSNLRTANLPY
jgi:hypothetical protein